MIILSDSDRQNLVKILVKIIHQHMEENDGEDVENEPIKPNINILIVSSLWYVLWDCRKKWNKNKKASQGTHEPVGEISMINEQGEVSKDKKKEGLEKCGQQVLHV